MGLAQPQVLISSLLSHVRLFSLGSPPARWREKKEENQPQQKKCFDTDLIASVLKDKGFFLSLYPSTNIPFGCFFFILRLQTCCSLPFYAACRRWLLTPEHMADRAAATLAFQLFENFPPSLSKTALRAAGSRSQAPEGQRSLGRTMASHCGSAEGEETKAGQTWIWPKLQCFQVMVT